MGILRRYVLASMVVGLALPTGIATVPLLPLSARAASRPPIIVTDPDAVVLGRTLTEWTALWLRWAFATPASALPEGCLPGQCYSAFNDPTGAYAEALQSRPHLPLDRHPDAVRDHLRHNTRADRQRA